LDLGLELALGLELDLVLVGLYKCH
jgi:hypothetical protein